MARSRRYPPAEFERVPPYREPDRSLFLDPFKDKAIRAYFEEIHYHHGFIHFLGLPHLGDHKYNADIPLRDLFIEPETGEARVQPDLPTDRWPPRRPLSRAIEETPRLVLLGDPGSGKSTALNWVAWRLSRAEGHPWSSTLGPLVPIPLVVRDLPITGSITWKGLLAAFLDNYVAKPLAGDRSHLNTLLGSGQAFLLLDGLDEIARKETREALRAAVFDGMWRYPACRWLMTSRVVGYEDVPFDRAANPASSARTDEDAPESLGSAVRFGMPTVAVSVATVAYVSPFDDRRIDEFVRLWFLRREPSSEVARDKAADLLRLVHAHPDTTRLARTPNLLAMLALIYRIRSELPHGRTLLYSWIAEAYLHSIDTYRKIPELNEVPWIQKKAWLAEVGFRMQLRRVQEQEEGSPPDDGETREILATTEEVLVWLLPAMRRDLPSADHELAGRYLDFLGRRSGLFLPRGEGRYAFTHLSFQEYFAACHIERQITGPLGLSDPDLPEEVSVDALRAYARDAAWRETFVHLFELMADRPRWPDALAHQLFGKDFETIRIDPKMPEAGPAPLLALLSIDPHSGLSDDRRKRAWSACWRQELQAQQSLDWTGQNAVTRILCGAPSIIAADVFRELGPQGEALRIHLINLAGCTGLAGDALAPLAGLTELKKLNLGGCTGLSGKALEPLAGLSGLRSLSLDHCTGLTNEALAPLARLSGLKVLHLSGCTGLMGEALAPLAGLEGLEELFLGGCTGLAGDALAPLAGLTRLKVLFLGSCTGLTAEALAPLVGLKGLKLLSVSGWTMLGNDPKRTAEILSTMAQNGTKIYQ